MKQATYSCQQCGEGFTARTADRARGWARFCSKTCKARAQGSRTLRDALASMDEADHDAGMSAMEDGWDGHKGAF